MASDIINKSIRELVDELLKLDEKKREEFFKANEGSLFGSEMEQKLRSASSSDVIDFVLLVPPPFFIKALETFATIISEKILEAKPTDIAKIFNVLTKDQRKQFTSRFMQPLTNFAKRLSIRDIINMILNVSSPSRPGLLSPMRPILFNPEFKKRILSSNLSELEEFISVLPDNIRSQLLKKHKDAFLSDDFEALIKSASREEITNLLLRWFPKDLYNEFIEKHKDVLSEKELKLQPM